jgi:hypothetical protein
MQGKLTSSFTPNQNDVLTGRGYGSQLYPGNVTFRHSVNKRKQQYAFLKGNKQKNELARAVCQEIQSLDPPGRFLSKSTDGSWTIQDEKAVMVKIKQALRERSVPRPKSPIHNAKSTGSSLDIVKVAKCTIFKKQDNEFVGSLIVTKHYSDFRAFLISDSPYLMSFASDDDHHDYIKRFLAGVDSSLTWKEFAHMCNYQYEESRVEAFLKAIWQLYPFLGNAYYFDSTCRPDSSSNDIKMFRTMDTKR